MMPRSLLKCSKVLVINIKEVVCNWFILHEYTNLNNPLKLDTFWLNLDDFKDRCLV